MNRSIATRTGDGGTTSLLYGQRVPKDHPQIEALGAFDELNVSLGAAKLALAEPERRALIESVQAALVAAMGELACAEENAETYVDSGFVKLGPADVKRLDDAVAALEARPRPAGGGWAVPGMNAAAVAFDQARVTARRAERRLCAVSSAGRTVRPEMRQWLNRLSDLLWLLARDAERRG